jgi:hypothetical protein
VIKAATIALARTALADVTAKVRATAGEVQSDNRWLIFRCRSVDEQPSSDRRLNAFFAISVNSPQ